jgi:hypothetical protein
MTIFLGLGYSELIRVDCWGIRRTGLNCLIPIKLKHRPVLIFYAVSFYVTMIFRTPSLKKVLMATKTN